LMTHCVDRQSLSGMSSEPSSMTRKRIAAWCPALILVLPITLWFWPLLAGYLPDFMDTVTHGYPLRLEAARQWREGVLPLWNPYQFCGVPLAANAQASLWYPPIFLFYLIP